MDAQRLSPNRASASPSRSPSRSPKKLDSPLKKAQWNLRTLHSHTSSSIAQSRPQSEAPAKLHLTPQRAAPAQAPRGWERQPRATTSQKEKKSKRIWKRPLQQTQGPNGAIVATGGEETPKKVVKKTRVKKEAEESRRGKRKGERVTGWERRESGLIHKTRNTRASIDEQSKHAQARIDTQTELRDEELQDQNQTTAPLSESPEDSHSVPKAPQSNEIEEGIVHENPLPHLASPAREPLRADSDLDLIKRLEHASHDTSSLQSFSTDEAPEKASITEDKAQSDAEPSASDCLIDGQPAVTMDSVAPTSAASEVSSPDVEEGATPDPDASPIEENAQQIEVDQSSTAVDDILTANKDNIVVEQHAESVAHVNIRQLATAEAEVTELLESAADAPNIQESTASEDHEHNFQPEDASLVLADHSSPQHAISEPIVEADEGNQSSTSFNPEDDLCAVEDEEDLASMSSSDSDSIPSPGADQALTFDIETLRPRPIPTASPSTVEDETLQVSPEQNVEDAPATPSQTYTVTLNDDETHLHDFLSRMNASKAAKIARQEHDSHKRDSDVIKHALAKDPLTEADANSSPQNSDPPAASITEGVAASPTLHLDIPTLASQRDETPIHGSPQRSSRKRKRAHPANAPPPDTEEADQQLSESAPTDQVRYSIALRRHHPDTAPLILQKTEAQKLATSTRNNTRRNKGGSVPVKQMLVKLQGGTVPAEAIDVGSPATVEGRRGVRWNEELVSFFQEKQEEGLFLETVGACGEEKDGGVGDQEKLKPRARRRSALGAMNGTPARGRLRDVEETRDAERKDEMKPRKRMRKAVAEAPGSEATESKDKAEECKDMAKTTKRTTAPSSTPISAAEVPALEASAPTNAGEQTQQDTQKVKKSASIGTAARGLPRPKRTGASTLPTATRSVRRSAR